MTILIHPNDLEQHQKFLLAMFLYHSFMAESDKKDGINMNEELAAEEAGEQFDKLYHYDNSHENKLKTTNTHTL